MRFAGRLAVITGGARGIGFSIAERLGREGARVVLWDRDGELAAAAAARLNARGIAAGAHALDVTDAASVAEAASALTAIDVLVNAAGITGPNAPTWDYPVDAWRAVVDVDLTGTFLCCRAIVPAMRAANYGRIVNVASVAGKDGNPNAPAYSAAKAGVIALTKSLAKELATTGIVVTAITPAAIHTAIFDQMTPEHIAYMRSKIPAGRFGTVDEAAALVAWLASEESSFSTGGIFDLSGGRSTY